jgi:hypothetical protein
VHTGPVTRDDIPSIETSFDSTTAPGLFDNTPPTELGAQYECGATPPGKFQPSATPQYGTYYGALLQVVTDGRPGGTIVLVWRRVNDEWRLVAYRAID